MLIFIRKYSFFIKWFVFCTIGGVLVGFFWFLFSPGGILGLSVAITEYNIARDVTLFALYIISGVLSSYFLFKQKNAGEFIKISITFILTTFGSFTAVFIGNLLEKLFAVEYFPAQIYNLQFVLLSKSILLIWPFTMILIYFIGNFFKIISADDSEIDK